MLVRTILCAVTIGLSVFGPAAAVAQIPVTTLVNPGFEIGTPGTAVTSGWSQISGLGPMYVATAGTLPVGIDPSAAHSGVNFLTASRMAPNPDDPTSQNMGVRQDVDLSPFASSIDLGAKALSLSFAYNNADTNDNGLVSFSFLDGANSPIGDAYSFATNSAPTAGNGWLTSSLLGNVPAGARTMRLSLQTTFTFGTVRNISFDSLAANLVDPPPLPPLGDRVNGNLIQFDGDGNWTWYSDERAVVDPNNGHVLVNSVGFSPSYVNNGQNVGLVDVVDFDPSTGRRVRTQLSNLSGVASQNIQRDDHNVGALLVLPDGRYLALYANHGNTGGLGDEWTRWRVSNNPGDSTSWSPEQVFNWFQQTPGVNQGGSPDAANVSYHNLFYLSEEDQVYNISRAFGQAPNIMRYDLETNSVAWAGQLADSSTGGYSTGYFKYTSNGVDRIYFTHTETHPRNFNTSIYSGYIENGQSFDMEGTLLDGNIFDNESPAGGAGGVPDVTQFTPVQIADPLGAGYNRLWTVDTNLDADGHPMALFVSRWNPDGSTSNGSTTNPIDHRLHYARWNEAAGEWENHEIAKMGNRLYRGTDVSEQDYTGNAALVPGDPNTIYISTPYDPRDAAGTTFTTEYEIYKGVTTDGGESWAWTAITENSTVDNLRPIVPDPHGGDTTVMWFRGRYTTAHSIDATVVGIVERQHEESGLVEYVDADAANTSYANGGALQTSTPSNGNGALDGLWHQRTGVGNGGSVLASSDTGFENAPQLKTTVEGLEAGVYDVFAYFWSDNDEDWRLMAGLESGNLVDFRKFGSQHASEDQFVEIEAVAANGNDLQLYRAYVGRSEIVDGAPLEVFVDDWQSLVGGAIRTWYDGLGYALVTPIVEGLAGDFNDDGVVDAADYTVWRNHLGEGDESNLHHNGDGGDVSPSDYDWWKQHYGDTAAGGGQGGLAAVPEPGALSLAILAPWFAAIVRGVRHRSGVRQAALAS